MTVTSFPLDPSARRGKLLVVDDQPVHLQVLHRALSTEHQMFVATNGEQALKVAREQRPDLVLLDVVMPGMDGFEVLHQFKTDAELADTPVIFVTAHGGDDIETQCLQAGAVDFISKPINPSVVRARVKTHLTLKFQSDLLRNMAFLDGLTGVSNRRQFDDRLLVEWGRAQRHGTALTLVLLDVDAFKPFNDHYGYWRGDEMIRLLARLATGHSDPQSDFVGHVGGDDFLILFQSADWRRRCEQIIAEFSRLARDLYDEVGRLTGGIHAEDRQGITRFFPCTTLAIGALRIEGGQFRDAEEVASQAALAKRQAKQTEAGLFVLECPGALKCS